MHKLHWRVVFGGAVLKPYVYLHRSLIIHCDIYEAEHFLYLELQGPLDSQGLWIVKAHENLRDDFRTDKKKAILLCNVIKIARICYSSIFVY